jgi:hypothetical protein
MQKVLMLHSITDEHLKLDLSDYDVFTFDDGLVSQYKHYKHFLSYGKPMHFFISTNIVCPEGVEQNKEVISSGDAHSNYFRDGDLSNFMKWSQIKEIYNKPNCYIGGHGHNHLRLKHENFIKAYKVVKVECKTMMDEFNRQGIEIDSFCFPYNEDIFGYRPSLKEHGVIKFFGEERIDVDPLTRMEKYK